MPTRAVRLGAVGLCLVVSAACGGRSPVVHSEPRTTRPEPVVIEIAKQNQQTVPVRLGAEITVVPPDSNTEWQISFASDVLVSLTPPEQMQRPGAGWRFRAAAIGQTDVAVTSIARCDSPPCPPTVMRLVVTIKVGP